MIVLTRAQREGLAKLYRRKIAPNGAYRAPIAQSYRNFRKQAQVFQDVVMVKQWNMWLGIEKDGYTHS